MNKILIIFLFNIILMSISYADNDDYNACATNDDGAILVKEEADDHTSFALESSPSNFTLTMGDDINIGGFCEATPDNYKVKMYKMGLCIENPWSGFDDNSNNTIGANLSSCIDIFNDSDGKEINIQPGKEVNLLDNGIVVPIGSFPYVYVLLDNVIQLKHIQEYALAEGGFADFTIRGYDPDVNNGTKGIGRFCYTGVNKDGNKFVSAFSNERSFGATTTLRGYTLPEKYTGRQETAKFHCGLEQEAKDDNDWFITIFNNIGEELTTGNNVGAATGRNTANFRNAGFQTRGFHKDFLSIAQWYYLYNSGDTIATSPGTVEKILFIQNDENNIVNISENTIAFKINFKTNNAIEIGVFEENTNDRVLQATEMNANTIFINVQTKTKRTRGTWR